MRAQRHAWNEVGLENALPEKWGLNGALEKRFRKRTTQKVRAQRRTRKEVGLENALPEKWGLNGALERGRVRKRTTQEVRAQRRTRKEVGLENALPKRWWWNTDTTNVESNALWSICMYVFVTYLGNIGPLFVVNFFELLFPFVCPTFSHESKYTSYPLSEEISSSLWGPFLLHWVLCFIIISKGRLKKVWFCAWKLKLSMQLTILIKDAF